MNNMIFAGFNKKSAEIHPPSLRLPPCPLKKVLLHHCDHCGGCSP